MGVIPWVLRSPSVFLFPKVEVFHFLEMSNGVAAVEIRVMIPQNFKNKTNMIQQLHFWVNAPKNWKQGLRESLVNRVHSSIICSDNAGAT